MHRLEEDKIVKHALRVTSAYSVTSHYIDMRPDLPKGVLYAHHLNTQISPSFDNKQTVPVCMPTAHQSAFAVATF